MARYRANLPQLFDRLFLTDGGLETTLVFHEGFDLPYFAACDLLKNPLGCETLRKYFRGYADLARKYEVGSILESVTWRANPDWGNKLGYSTAELADLNRKAIALLQEVRNECETDKTPIVVSGCIGPRGDGYNPDELMDAAEAQDYHAMQAEALHDADADMISAMTITYPEEAIGITRAAQSVEMPVAISFTVETDGRLPTGQTLQSAIEQADAATDNGPIYYMINCAHPTHFERLLGTGEAWLDRLWGIRANASTKSHAELDEAEELDDGDPADLGDRYGDLKRQLKNLTIIGGCCGTDRRHVEEMCKAFLAETA